MNQLSRAGVVQLTLHRVSWMLFLRGACGMAFGALAIVAWDLPALVRASVASAVADGLLALAIGRARSAADEGARSPLWPLMLSGFTGLAGGAGSWMAADSGQALTILGISLVMRGVFDVLSAIVLRDAGYNERLLGTAAASTLVAGAILAACDLHGLAWRVPLAVHACVAGAATASLARRVRLPRPAVPVHGRFSTPRAIVAMAPRSSSGAGPPAAAP